MIQWIRGRLKDRQAIKDVRKLPDSEKALLWIALKTGWLPPKAETPMGKEWMIEKGLKDYMPSPKDIVRTMMTMENCWRK